MYNPQLETFIRVADAGSFNKAAEELFITPPAIIKQITSLETGLDLQLFNRTHRGLTLTEARKSIYRDAKYLIKFCKEAEVRARNAVQEGDRVIRIGTSPMTPGQFLMDLWQEYPQINIVDFDFLSINVFNQCENSEDIMMTIDNWQNIHPLLKTISIDWNYTIPVGLFHAPKPSPTVRQFLSAVKTVLEL